MLRANPPTPSEVPQERKTNPLETYARLAAVLAITSQTERQGLTPRQQQALNGAEACVMLCAHPGKMDLDEVEALAKAGLVFGAILAGER